MDILFISLAVAGLAALLVLYIAVYQKEAAPDAPQKADCIIILGSKVHSYGPSKSLEYRLEKGLELYREGYAPVVIVCGGKGNDEHEPEADAMKRWLMENGMKEEHIYTDRVSRNTKENLLEAKKIMEANGYETAVVCTTDYHSYRAMRLAEDIGITAYPAKAKEKWQGKAMGRFRECLSWVKYFITR